MSAEKTSQDSLCKWYILYFIYFHVIYLLYYILLYFDLVKTL